MAETKRKSLGEWLIGAKSDKQVWRGYVRRRDALRPDYRAVMRDIEGYIYNIGVMDASGMAIFTSVIDLFEEGQAAGQPVLEVTGDDVAGFAYEIMTAVQARTWTGDQAGKLNQRVRRHLAELGAAK